MHPTLAEGLQMYLEVSVRLNLSRRMLQTEMSVLVRDRGPMSRIVTKQPTWVSAILVSTIEL
jgi:hypothetical protein